MAHLWRDWCAAYVGDEGRELVGNPWTVCKVIWRQGGEEVEVADREHGRGACDRTGSLREIKAQGYTDN